MDRRTPAKMQTATAKSRREYKTASCLLSNSMRHNAVEQWSHDGLQALDSSSFEQRRELLEVGENAPRWTVLCSSKQMTKLHPWAGTAG